MTRPADELNAPVGDATDLRPRQRVADLLGPRGDWRVVDGDTWVVTCDLRGDRWRVWRRSTADRALAIGGLERHASADAAMQAARGAK